MDQCIYFFSGEKRSFTETNFELNFKKKMFPAKLKCIFHHKNNLDLPEPFLLMYITKLVSKKKKNKMMKWTKFRLY